MLRLGGRGLGIRLGLRLCLRRSSVLGRYDLQQQRRLPDIPLTGIAEVGKIRMTTTNTVCY